MNIFCVTEQKYATIADGLAFLLRAKVVALRLPKLLILVKGREESIILRVIEKIGRPRSYQSRDLSITSMMTDRIRHHKVLLPINHNHYNFEKKNPIHLGQTSPLETMSIIKNSFIWEIAQFFSRMSGCCYCCYDQLCDWWIQLSRLSSINGKLQPTVRLHCSITTVQNDWSKITQLKHQSHLRKFFDQSFCTVVIEQCNRTVGCNFPIVHNNNGNNHSSWKKRSHGCWLERRCPRLSRHTANESMLVS